MANIVKRRTMKLLALQIYHDESGREVYTQRVYGSMVEYKYPDDHKLFVTLKDRFLEEHTYIKHYGPRGWGEE
jgi:hypothetical protein